MEKVETFLLTGGSLVFLRSFLPLGLGSGLLC